jgi:tetratricopeptide (TPR) repeat protein
MAAYGIMTRVNDEPGRGGQIDRIARPERVPGCLKSGRVRQLDVVVCVALVAAVWLVFGPTRSFEFVAFDDPAYVTAEPHVRGGLTRAGVRWAFTAPRIGNWHPVTLVSHMLDCTLFGLDPGWHHAMNVALHAAGTVALYGLLRISTGARWPSVVVAALFALHPLHVEPVAWVAGRKDVLSALFGWLTIWTYVAWTRRGGGGRYVLAVIFYALGLMAKPTVVTLPALLLLWDWWPLGRVGRGGAVSWARAVAEKTPFVALAVTDGVLTLGAQMGAGAVAELVPVGARVGNAVVTTVWYLAKTMWPTGLAVHYPHPALAGGTPWAGWQVVGAGFLLLGATVGVWATGRRYARVGWLWYLGMLVPMSGVVAQVGSQGMADRYTYMPLVGVFVAVVWGAAEAITRGGAGGTGRRIAGACGTVAALIACGALARGQTAHWRDSIALARRAIAVSPTSFSMRNNLGIALQERGRIAAAIVEYREAIRINPGYAKSYGNLAVALQRQGDHDAAIAAFRQALALDPEFAKAHANLGAALLELGRRDEALVHLRTAVDLDPGHALALERLGYALAAAGRVAEAVDLYGRALAIQPDFVDAANHLGMALYALGRYDDAIVQYARALAARPGFARARNNLGLALQARGEIDAALAEYRQALVLEPDNARAHNNLGTALHALGRLEEARASYARALAREPSFVDAQYNLGLALQQLGQPDQAVAAYRQALALRPDYVKARENLAILLGTADVSDATTRQQPDPPGG